MLAIGFAVETGDRYIGPDAVVDLHATVGGVVESRPGRIGGAVLQRKIPVELAPVGVRTRDRSPQVRDQHRLVRGVERLVARHHLEGVDHRVRVLVRGGRRTQVDWLRHVEALVVLAHDHAVPLAIVVTQRRANVGAKGEAALQLVVGRAIDGTCRRNT